MHIEKQGLTPNECLTIQIALAMMIENTEAIANNPKYPLTPEARKEIKQMLLAAKSAKAKIDSCIGKEVIIAPYKEGGEDEFLTKQS